MKYYKRITCFENNRRVKKLYKFRDFVIEYFENKPASFLVDDMESAESCKKRVEINRILDEVHGIITAAGIYPVLKWSPPPMVGGYAQKIDLIMNMTRINHYQIPRADVFDFIDRALGVYESDFYNSRRRVFNPFFWLDELFRLIAQSPFNILRSAGFKTENIENSFLGKLFKLIAYLAGLVASLLGILQMLGRLEAFKVFVKKIF